ncbi:MAG: hypothetical protein A2173_07875 [Planctomycetes bacterium RBG_13_44_8b]|nr:MAG: hypothetical protein A2173_07875 [Planctomycetes bacterium RBG_13_44_8b]
MLKIRLLTLATVLFIQSSAFADIAGIAQEQNYAIGADNLIALVQGKNIASNINLGIVTNDQTAINSCGLWAIQDDNAIFTQKGYAIGACSQIGVLQSGTAIGEQCQMLVGCFGPKAQGQELELGLAQQVNKSNGEGTATAEHEFFADRLQALGSISGSMNADQFISVTQDSNINGDDYADGKVTNSACINSSQVQAIN